MVMGTGPFKVANGDAPRLNRPRTIELVAIVCASLVTGGGGSWFASEYHAKQIERNRIDLKEHSKSDGHAALETRVFLNEHRLDRMDTTIREINTTQRKILDKLSELRTQ